MLIRDKQYRMVIQPAHKFFGFIQIDAYGSPVNMAEREKTILDSLDRPGYAGDIPEVAGMIQRGKSNLDWNKLVDYAVRFETKALLQRLGYLIDLLNLPIEPEARNRLFVQASGNTKCYLGQPRRWHTGGNYNATWRVVGNIPRRELLAEIEVR
jgi:predicted transcriptional regulator of viral defense system